MPVASVAYVRDKYHSTISDDRIDNETATVGFVTGYKRTHLFGVKHLYINAVPVLFQRNPGNAMG